jgi:hypothetical protein
MTSYRVRLGLSFIVSLSCWVGKVQAQAPAETGGISVHMETSLDTTPMTPATRDRSLHGWLNRCGYGCAQELDWYGCGGWRQQNLFVFGSCRTFFAEPCIPKGPKDRGAGPGHWAR